MRGHNWFMLVKAINTRLNQIIKSAVRDNLCPATGGMLFSELLISGLTQMEELLASDC